MSLGDYITNPSKENHHSYSFVLTVQQSTPNSKIETYLTILHFKIAKKIKIRPMSDISETFLMDFVGAARSDAEAAKY